MKIIDEDISLILLYFLVDGELPDPIKLSDEHESYIWLNNRADLPKGLNPEIEKILKSLLS